MVIFSLCSFFSSVTNFEKILKEIKMEIKLFGILLMIIHLNSNGLLLISMVDILRAKTSLNTLWVRTQAKEVPCRGSYSSQGRSPSYAKNGNRTKIASPLRPLASKSTIDEYFISRKLSSLEVCADRGQLVSMTRSVPLCRLCATAPPRLDVLQRTVANERGSNFLTKKPNLWRPSDMIWQRYGWWLVSTEGLPLTLLFRSPKRWTLC